MRRIILVVTALAVMGSHADARSLHRRQADKRAAGGGVAYAVCLRYRLVSWVKHECAEFRGATMDEVRRYERGEVIDDPAMQMFRKNEHK